ncbi:MAG: hypothetical protein ACK56I_10725 [bacterium]
MRSNPGMPCQVRLVTSIATGSAAWIAASGVSRKAVMVKQMM